MPALHTVLVFCIIAVACFSKAYAWESFPEFESLTERDESAFDQPSLLGPEYQSDILAYSKLPKWEYNWLSHEIAFDTSIGSISAVYFLTDTRAKIRSNLLDWMQFRFTYYDERNFDRQSSHAIFELVFQPPKGVLHHFGLALYGEPSYYKRQNDIGVALMWWPTDHHEIRFFNSWVDVTRQKRNDQNDKFVGNNLPYSRGIVGRYWYNSESFIEYAARYETPTQWRFPDQQYDYRFWREFASLYYSNRFNDFWKLTTRIQADRKFEARDPLSASSTVSAASWTTDRLIVNIEGTIYGIGPYRRWDLNSGLEWAHRKWTTLPDTLIYNDWLPHFQLNLPGFGEGDNEGRWLLGYMFTWHRKVGGGIINHPSDKDDVLNHRLDVSYSFNFNKNTELRLLASFDLDALGTNDTWEGGNAQFRWYLP